MNALQDMATSPAAQALGWALMHLLWQGMLISMLLKILLRGIPAHLAGVRYWIASAALIAMLCMPGISVWKAFSVRPEAITVAAQDAPSVQDVTAVPQRVAPHLAPAQPDARLDWQWSARARLGALVPWLSILWLGGMVLSASVMMGGLCRAQFLKRSATSLTGDGWARKLASLSLNSRARVAVRLLESDRVSVPTVIGWYRPAILLPAGAAGELEAEHLDALLAHELAHIRRRDYLVNLVQTAIEVLLWYHPAAWWVAVQVRAERECCCDDEAVAVCGSRLTYARALSRAERLRSASKWAVALSGASLLNRIRRLTEMKTPTLGRLSVYLIGVFAIGMILATGAGSSLLAYVPAVFERPVADSTPALPQAAQPELPSPIAVLKNQTATVNQTVRKEPVQEKFVRPTEVPREIKPEKPPAQARFVQPVEVPQEVKELSDLRRLEIQLAVARGQLEALSQRLAQSHPDMVRLKKTIADLESQKANLWENYTQQVALGPKIAGHVYDPAGAVIPGVAISLLSPGGKQTGVNVWSDASGYFEIDTFASLDFELRFEVAGFAPQVLARRNLGAGPLDVTLELGQIKETVTITAGAPTGAVAATGNPVRVGGNIVPPRVIYRVDPVYSPQAKIENVEGTVVVSALIDEEGQVKDAIMLSGHPLLKDAALESVRQWRYSPAVLNGQPWPMRLSITLVFKLAR